MATVRRKTGRRAGRRPRAARPGAPRASLEEYRALLAAALDPIICIDSFGIIRSASDSARTVFGWAPHELIGENVSVLMPEPHHSRHSDYLADFRRTGRTSILGRRREFLAARRDGTTVPVEICVNRVDLPNHQMPLFVGIIRDLSERKRAEAEILLLKSLALAIAEATSLADAMIRVLRTICETAGWDYGEVWMASPLEGLLLSSSVWASPTLSPDQVEPLRLSQVRVGEGLPGRVWTERRPIWLCDLRDAPVQEFVRREAAMKAGLLATAAVPILADDRVVAVLLFMMRSPCKEDQRLLDLVAAAVGPLGSVVLRRRAEDELERSRQNLAELVAQRTAQLESTHEQLRVADRLAAIGTLAAGLGHDMHNVLLPVRARLNALAAAGLHGPAREHLGALRRSVDYLQQLSDALHLLAMNPDESAPADALTHLGPWWKQVRPLLARAVPRTVRLVTRLPARLPPAAVAPHRLTQAILNLIVNAGEAHRFQGDARPGAWVRVFAEAAPRLGVIRIGVADNGPGMPPEVKARAFDPFFTTKKRGLGTGLGLSLVRNVALSAGGTVALDSAPGKGTTVVLSLPIATRDDRGSRRAVGRRRALVSVSDPRLASLVRQMLHSAGLSARIAPAARPGAESIWVTDPVDGSLRAARAFLRAHSGRRVVCLGPDTPDQSWTKLGAVVVERIDDFELLRHRLGQATSPPAAPASHPVRHP